MPIAEEPMVLMKCDLELLTRLHDMFPATAAEAKGLLDTYRECSIELRLVR